MQAIQTNGLKLKSDLKEEHTLAIPATTAEEFNGKADVIFVCVKGYSVDSITELIKRAAHDKTIVIPILNVYGTGPRIQRLVPGVTVLDGCIYIVGFVSGTGEITQMGKIFRLVYGAHKGTPGILEAVQKDLQESGIKAEISPDINRDTFIKWSFISAMAVTGAYYDVPMGEVQKPGKVRDTFIGLSTESAELGRKLGVEFPEDPISYNLKVIDKLDPEYGFYRLYNYNFSLQASTIIYGRYEAKKKTRKVQAIRHTITPTVSFSYAPDFSKQKYGYVKTVQSDTLGNFKTYSPFEGSIFGVPSSGQSMAINASLSQTLEMKVLSKRDTSGMKKIKLIDELRIGQVSYNFLADSMGLSNIPISLRTTVFQNFGININATLDPYRVTPQGQRINKLFFPGRVVSASTSFGYTFQSRQDNSTPAINDINSAPVDPAYANPFYDPYGQMNPALRRQYMTQAYYDFSLPWNLGFNYTISYSASPTNNGTTGYQKNITQTLGINGSVTILPKMGVTIQGGYDFQAKELTPASITITRDLHCWQMSFAWVPFGHYQSWSFNIGVKAASLADLKYDKSQSMFDNLY